MSAKLWVEDYRPQTLDDYVWQDQQTRRKAEEWLADGVLPNVLFSGTQGTGKTSLAKLLLKLLGIPKGDILEKNASRERKIDDLQDQIVSFASTWALNDTGFKYVLLDEADSLSPLAQKFLRGEIEKFHDSCRFILTCNYPQKITPPLHSRLQEYKFSALDMNDYVARVGEVLSLENVAFEIDDLLGYVELTYPDLRKCVGMVQQYTLDGKLAPPPSAEAASGKDYLVDMVNMFKGGRFVEARKLITAQAQVEEYPDIYRFFYQNLGLWGNTDDQQDEALLIVRRALVNHALVADPEINLAACLVELTRVTKG